MPKSSPEKLAAALRANLKRRKQASDGAKGQHEGRAAKSGLRPSPADASPKPPKNSA